MFFNISYYSNRTMDSSPNCVTSKCQMKSIYSCHTHRNNIHKFARPHFCSGNPSFAFETTLCNSFHSLSSYIHGWLVHFDRRRIDLAPAGVMWDLYLWRISLFFISRLFFPKRRMLRHEDVTFCYFCGIKVNSVFLVLHFDHLSLHL